MNLLDEQALAEQPAHTWISEEGSKAGRSSGGVASVPVLLMVKDTSSGGPPGCTTACSVRLPNRQKDVQTILHVAALPAKVLSGVC